MRFIGTTIFTLGVSLVTAQPCAALAIDGLLQRIDGQFRSSSRHVAGLTLFEESWARIAPVDLRELSGFERKDVLEALRRSRESLDVNRGVAENVLKIHQMTKLCTEFRPIHPSLNEQECSVIAKDGVSGLPQDEIDHAVLGFSEATAHHENEFDFDLQELIKLGVRDALDTDWYKFKMAAIIFEYGLHLNKRVTYNMFSRGKENRPYYVVGGTSLAIDALPHFRFGEREIQYIKNHSQFKNVSPAFFDYLRRWRFGRNPQTGKIDGNSFIRAVPEGTVMFANETLMEITTDPLSATLVECLLSPLIDTVTTSATKVARVVLSHGAPVVEGGTRRSGHALLGAYGALIGMAVGTSNAKVSRLMKTLPYGSMEHALFGLFKNEMRTMIAYDRFFPGSTFLIDENAIMDGWRTAVRVAGKSMGGTRTDSELEGQGLGGTSKTLAEHFEELQYVDAKVLVSNRINEYQLSKLDGSNSKISSILIGTEAQNPSDANGSNIVYKLTQVVDLDTKIVTPIAKASVGKVGIPGETEVFRVLAPINPEAQDKELKYRAAKDYIAIKGEIVPDGIPLLVDALGWDGKRLLPRDTIAVTAARTREQIGLLPDELKTVDAKAGAYPVELTRQLRKKQETVLRLKRRQQYRVGVQIGSFNPVHDAHVKIATRSRLVYNFDRTLVVPSHQNPIHGKQIVHPVEERVKMLHQRYDATGIEVDEREANAPKGAYTIDTLRAIREEARREHGPAEVFTVVGDDLFNDLTGQSGSDKWKNHRKELLSGDFSWVVHKRDGNDEIVIPDGLLGPAWERLSRRHYENNETGAVIELVDLNVGNKTSSTRERELADGVDTIFHGVDLQWTFWEARGNREPGTMAVKGSNAIYDNVVKLTELARDRDRIKSILTKDFHQELELKNPERWNEREFAPKDGRDPWPPHGMAQRAGGVGHEILWGVADVFSAGQRLVVPHKYEKRGVRADLNTLELADFDPAQFAYQIVDPRVQLVIQKNGPESYDFAANPHAERVVSRLKKVRHVVVYGVATDYCVKAAANTYLDWGYEVSIVTDAIAGVDVKPGDSQNALSELEERGARLVTTQQIVDEYAEPPCPTLLASAPPAPEAHP